MMIELESGNSFKSNLDIPTPSNYEFKVQTAVLSSDPTTLKETSSGSNHAICMRHLEVDESRGWDLVLYLFHVHIMLVLFNDVTSIYCIDFYILEKFEFVFSVLDSLSYKYINTIDFYWFVTGEGSGTGWCTYLNTRTYLAPFSSWVEARSFRLKEN